MLEVKLENSNRRADWSDQTFAYDFYGELLGSCRLSNI